MATLDSLIRLRQYRIDEKRRVIAGLLKEASTYEIRKEALIIECEKERAAVSEIKELNAMTYFMQYERGVTFKMSQLDSALAKINKRIEVAQDDLRDMYAELKKIEITKKNRQSIADAKQKAKDDQAMDEIALQIFRRHQSINETETETDTETEDSTS
jgi:flagellar biosynthesis chaperone FliJ